MPFAVLSTCPVVPATPAAFVAAATGTATSGAATFTAVSAAVVAADLAADFAAEWFAPLPPAAAASARAWRVCGMAHVGEGEGEFRFAHRSRHDLDRGRIARFGEDCGGQRVARRGNGAGSRVGCLGKRCGKGEEN